MASFRLSLVLSFFLVACASSPNPQEAAAEATDRCLANPELAQSWGECNVKSTLFSRSEAINQCSIRFGKGKESDQMLLQIRLKPDGKVMDVKSQGSHAKNKGLERCLIRELSKLQFAAPPAGAKPLIEFPFAPN